MTQTVSSVRRGAFGGLVLGMLGGALLLGVLGVRNATRPCTVPSDTLECQFEEQTWGEVARLQAFASVGLALVGGGLLLLRRKDQAR